MEIKIFTNWVEMSKVSMNWCTAFEMCRNGWDDLVVLQKISFDVVFVIEFLWWKVIALIIQQILYKNNILVSPGLPINRFVFNIYVSVIP